MMRKETIDIINDLSPCSKPLSPWEIKNLMEPLIENMERECTCNKENTRIDDKENCTFKEILEMMICIFLHRYSCVAGVIKRDDLRCTILVAGILALKCLDDCFSPSFGELAGNYFIENKKTLVRHEMNFLKTVSYQLCIRDLSAEYSWVAKHHQSKE